MKNTFNRSGRSSLGSAVIPVALIMFSVVAATLTAQSRSVGAQDDAGAELYRTSCASCHQVGGEGLPGAFPPLAGNPAAADTEYVSTVIVEGLSGPLDVLGEHYDAVMPPVPGLSDGEIADIATYVATLAASQPGDDAPDATTPDTPPATTVPAEPPTEGDADRGRDLFVGSDRLDAGGTACASCHTAGDVGNLGGQSLGPDLTEVYNKFGGEAGMSAWLANPGSQTMLPIFTDRPMTEEEIAHVVAFLADAPNRDQPSDSSDWLLVSGLIGLAILIGGMAIAWRGMRQPYAETLRSPR